MTEAEANSRQKELNADLGAAWEERDFYVAVQRKGGDWDVERRHAKLTRRERMWRLVAYLPYFFPP